MQHTFLYSRRKGIPDLLECGTMNGILIRLKSLLNSMVLNGSLAGIFMCYEKKGICMPKSLCCRSSVLSLTTKN